MRRFSAFGGRKAAAGFSMIEVLVTMIVLAFGLLGFALLQTMNVRFVQSSNYRTQATNLAYELLDQMRANRYQYAWYTNASFTAGSVNRAACSRQTGGVTIAQNVARWQCQVVQALGEGASAQVQNNNGRITVGIAWADQRWDKDNPDSRTTFTAETQL